MFSVSHWNYIIECSTTLVFLVICVLFVLSHKVWAQMLKRAVCTQSMFFSWGIFLFFRGPTFQTIKWIEIKIYKILYQKILFALNLRNDIVGTRSKYYRCTKQEIAFKLWNAIQSWIPSKITYIRQYIIQFWHKSLSICKSIAKYVN